MEVTFKMNIAKKSFLLITLLLLVLVPSVFAQGSTVPDTIAANSDLSTLAAAIEAAGLTETLSSGEWTIFAPTNEAFAKIGITPGTIANLDVAYLKDLLLHHVMSGDLSTANLKTMLGNITMGNGALAGLSYYDGDLYINDSAKVIDTNILGGNGRIQIIDTVLQGPWPRVAEADMTEAEEGAETVADETGMPTEVPAVDSTATDMTAEETAAADTTMTETVTPTVPENSIVGIAMKDGRFNTVLAAVTAADLVDDLAAGEWTAFVPTDAAFAKLGLTADNIAGAYTQQELADLLLYHLMIGNYSTAQLKTMLGNVIMANGQQAGLKYFDDSVWVNDDSRVIGDNIVTDNGTIHVVDNVILPPWPRIDSE